MKRLLLTVLALVLVCGLSCRKSHPKTAVIDVPEMKNDACVKVIRNALATVGGLDHANIMFDPGNRTVTVTYESLFMALKNVEFEIAKTGFQANTVPADPKAAKALPAACKS